MKFSYVDITDNLWNHTYFYPGRQMLLSADNLSFAYPHRPLFRGVDVLLHPGQVVQITGPNGVGKSSLLKILCGLLPSLTGMLESAPLSYISHQTGVCNLLSAWENLTLNQPFFVNNQQAEQVLENIKLSNHRNQLASYLSMGQQRRLALARLLLHKTPLWILDEPFASLDQQGTTWLAELIQDHLGQNGAVVITTHQTLPLNNIKYLNLENYAV